MSNGVKSVGSTDDVEGVSYRSAPELEASDVVDIEDCGIPLDCTSAGDSFEAQDPCENPDLSIYNVMGQEDRFRQEDGLRVDRGGTARIIIGSEDDTIINKIEYTRNPSNEDNPALNDTWTPSTSANNHHEVFVNSALDSLYAFRVEFQIAGCPEEKFKSGIYYFNIGNEAVTLSDTNFNTSIEMEIVAISYSEIIALADLYSLVARTNPNHSFLGGSISADLLSLSIVTLDKDLLVSSPTLGNLATNLVTS